MTSSYKRMTLPPGYLMGTATALAVAWAPYVVFPGGGLQAPGAQTVIFLGLGVLTARSRRLKILLVRGAQRWVINPAVRSLFAVGLNPLGLVILETRGRVSGRPRRTPVGDGRAGDTLWIIAEHGSSANYVRNICHDPRVRVRIRQGLCYRWVAGVATVLPDDDPLARQRRIARWHPLRAFNAMNVRLLGADLLTVRIDLAVSRRGLATPAATDPTRAVTPDTESGPALPRAAAVAG